MVRAHKMTLALLIAVVVHAALLLFSLAPRLAGLANDASASAEQTVQIRWAAATVPAELPLSPPLDAIEAIQPFKLALALPTTAEAAAGAPAAVSDDSEYASRVRQHLVRFAGALPAGASGEARVQFVVQPDGRVSEVFLAKPSGNAVLDAMALNLPGKAQPLPPPGAMPQRLEVPVQAIASSAAP